MTALFRVRKGNAFPRGKPGAPRPNTVPLGILPMGVLPGRESVPLQLRRRRPTFRGLLRRLGGLLPRPPILPSPSPRSSAE